MAIARSPENKKKNRFANIPVCEFVSCLHLHFNKSWFITDDDNRVILEPMEDLTNEYINASYVDVSPQTFM